LRIADYGNVRPWDRARLARVFRTVEKPGVSGRDAREALTVAQRYPADFDGVSAEVPTVHFLAAGDLPVAPARFIRLRDRCEVACPMRELQDTKNRANPKSNLWGTARAKPGIYRIKSEDQDVEVAGAVDAEDEDLLDVRRAAWARDQQHR
jgi:hypothetical protein